MARAQRVLVAMSGGVDSSVTAAILVEEGFDVVGATMKTFCYQEAPGHGKTCCGLEGISDARRVADHLGIPHYVYDVEDEFTRDVVDDFVSEYARGRTPNPCVRCNSNTKFRDLMKRGRVLGCDAIASGHYVRIEGPGTASATLHRGVDPEKDQSYFLWGLPRSMLRELRFPLGDLTKAQVRRKARELELITAQKPESQEICFVPSGDYRNFLSRKLSPRHSALEPGKIVTRDGTEIGSHDGYAGFTVGQRRGLGGGFSKRMYVLEIRPESREVVVGSEEELYAETVTLRELNWLTASPPPVGGSLSVQVRYGAQPAQAEVLAADRHELTLLLRTPEKAVTPGQSGVLYEGDQLLGGGRIAGTQPAMNPVRRQPASVPA